MFDKDIIITGKHANYIRFLSPRKKPNERIFDRYIDVYMNAAIIGFIYGEKEDRDKSDEHINEQPATIFLEAVSKERTNLLFIYRTIMLLHNKENLSPEQR